MLIDAITNQLAFFTVTTNLWCDCVLAKVPSPKTNSSITKNKFEFFVREDPGSPERCFRTLVQYYYHLVKGSSVLLVRLLDAHPPFPFPSIGSRPMKTSVNDDAVVFFYHHHKKADGNARCQIR
jgi:hypothetical protein